MSPRNTDREAVPELPNRLGLAGIEFVEYITNRPQAFGQALELNRVRWLSRPGRRSSLAGFYRRATAGR